MIGRRAVIGLSLLCALAFSAIAVASASAETKTTTAFTCVKAEGGKGFSKEHCAAADAVNEKAAFKHEEIKPGSWTTIEATNDKTGPETSTSTNAVLNATIGGLKAVITAKKVIAHGELENFEDPVTKAMDIKQRKVIITYTEAVLSGALATVEGCKVVKSEVVTNELEATSLVNTHESVYSGPGKVFAIIKLEGCKTKELNEKGIEVTGTANAIGDGATIETTAASTAGLKAAGQPASYTSKLTPRMINPTTKFTEAPIAPTTILDP
jgi:hypothetical protein